VMHLGNPRKSTAKLIMLIDTLTPLL
jgi:hypothetical protein